ncbi:MAG: B12-binding domain-containing radical SAM protein, partial [Candidatus Heimdallarchaeota archaeon]|nr:B12-binding domain-containing radical SAM protein [Candidatus Heimdallarchaeota archaeon]
LGIRILPNTGLEKIAREEKVIEDDEIFLEPVYYISPALDKDWLEKTLNDSFSRIRYCIFPPDAMDSSLQFLHKMGYSGSMWDMLLKKKQRKRSKNVL